MRKTFRILFGIMLIAIGVGIYTYPVATTEYQAYQTKKYIEVYEDKWNEDSEEKNALLKEIKGYNEKIYQTGQKDFCDAWSYTQSPISLDGLKDNKYGYIEIPAMDVKLPLYIGASEENLRKGATVLGQTSIPIGEKNQNSVIAAHRGYQGAPYFREIEKLSPGDKVFIKNPWEKLTYYVESCAVISPYDNDAVKIQKGKDMITLVTCHPYRSHGKYRYIVYCTREKTVDQQTKTVSTEYEFISSEPDIKRENMVRKMCAVILIAGILSTIISLKRNREEEKNG